MPWTEITRPQYRRADLTYTSDLTVAERQLIEPLVPERRRRLGRPRSTALRQVVEAMFYLATTGVIDSQSVKTMQSTGPRGFNAGKRIKGRKRHIVTDTAGHLIGLVVHDAGVQDRDGAPAVLAGIRRLTSGCGTSLPMAASLSIKNHLIFLAEVIKVNVRNSSLGRGEFNLLVQDGFFQNFPRRDRVIRIIQVHPPTQ